MKHHVLPHPAKQQETKPLSGLPGFLWFILAVLAGLAILSPDWVPGLYGVGVLLFCAKLLWVPGQPQTLFFICSFQWFQTFGAVLQAAVENLHYSDMHGVPELETAIWLSFTAIGTLAAGFKLATRSSEGNQPLRTQFRLKSLSGSSLFWFYAAATLLSMGIRVGARSFAPAIQMGSAIEIWKWGMVLLIFYRWVTTGLGRTMAISILALETVIGVLGIFSAFKTGFILLLIAGTGVERWHISRAAILSACGAFLILLLGFWQAVKGYYRSFMNEGEKAQVVTVSSVEQAQWLLEASKVITFDHIKRGWQDGLRRVTYVDYFGYSIRTVPASVPHADGQLWAEAVQHVLKPRILFPNKPAIDDSVRTNTYTGVDVTGAESGTSISIGYVGESYIDFGSKFMFAPIFAWGAFCGAMYNWLRRKAQPQLLGTCLGTAMLVQTTMLLESSNLKMFGGVLVAFIGLALLLKIFGRGVWYFLIGGKRRSSRLLSGHGKTRLTPHS